MSGQFPIAERSHVWRAARGEIRAERGAFTALLTLNVLAAVAGLIGPIFLGKIVDTVKNQVAVGGEARSALASVDRYALVIVGFAVLQILFARFAFYIGSRFGERTAARIRERFVERALTLPASVVEHSTTGDLVARGTADASLVAATLRDSAPQVLVAVVQAVFIVVAVVVLNPLLGVSGLLCLAGDVFLLRWYLNRAHAAFLAEGAAGTRIAEVIETTASGARTVEALGLQQQRIAAGERAFAAAVRARLRSLRLRLVFYPVTDASYVLPMAWVLLVGGELYGHGAVSLGVVVASAIYLRQLIAPLDTILQSMQQLQNAGASYARVEGLAAVPEAEAPTADIPADDRIEVSGAYFSYNAAHGDILHDIDLAVQPGERLAIVGSSGAGKSTLGRLLAGIDAPRLGAVTVGGVAIAALPPERLRRQVVLVTQEHHVFHDTLRGNLLLAKATATDAELHAALALVGADWTDRLPGGLDTVLTDSGHRLDGAQAQQLALARVILADPHTVILDEATALLDPTTARKAEHALAAVLKGRTVIAIAHRLQTAHDADRVAVMDTGVITELGTHDELVAAGGVYAELWRSWHGD